MDCLADGSIVASAGTWLDAGSSSGRLSSLSCSRCDGDECKPGAAQTRGPVDCLSAADGAHTCYAGRLSPPEVNPLCGRCLPEHSEWCVAVPAVHCTRWLGAQSTLLAFIVSPPVRWQGRRVRAVQRRAVGLAVRHVPSVLRVCSGRTLLQPALVGAHQGCAARVNARRPRLTGRHRSRSANVLHANGRPVRRLSALEQLAGRRGARMPLIRPFSHAATCCTFVQNVDILRVGNGQSCIFAHNDASLVLLGETARWTATQRCCC